MPTYSYRCAACGPFDLVRPMAAAHERAECPTCAAPGARTFGAPGLRRLDGGVRAAVEAAERSAEAPEVVRRVPGGGRRPVPRRSTDPRHARLPRP